MVLDPFDEEEYKVIITIMAENKRNLRNRSGTNLRRRFCEIVVPEEFKGSATARMSLVARDGGEGGNL